jgi:hypothetical protein
MSVCSISPAYCLTSGPHKRALPWCRVVVGIPCAAALYYVWTAVLEVPDDVPHYRDVYAARPPCASVAVGVHHNS